MDFFSAVTAGIGLRLGSAIFDFSIFVIVMLVFFIAIWYLNRRK